MNKYSINSMHQLIKPLFFIVVLLSCTTAEALELTGRFSMLGSPAFAEPGDVGYVDGNNRVSTADQQSVRLMLDDSSEQAEWSVHLKIARQHHSGYLSPVVSSSLFRYDTLAENWLDESNGVNNTLIGYEVDRAVYRRRYDNVTFTIGRQPIDWGSGRFWQPLNIFGAFAPTDLDTDFKPGIDAALLDWYPSAFSSLTGAYVAKPKENSAVQNSGALYYRRQVGDISELSILGGSVLGNTVVGGSFESAWNGMGWRVEGAHYTLDTTNESFLFWIAGIDYQFSDGTLIAAEWYDNGHGATSQAEISTMLSDPLVGYGLQQQLGRQVLGLMVDRDLTPLLHGSYTVLAAAVNDDNNKLATSLLHQFTLSYSVSNESDLLFSLLFADGRGVNGSGLPQSEFGYIPATMTLRLRFYF
jgi:hypothetical protein